MSKSYLMNEKPFFKARKQVRISVAEITKLLNIIYDKECKDISNKEIYIKKKDYFSIINDLINSYIKSNSDLFKVTVSFSIKKRLNTYFDAIKLKVIRESQNPLYTICSISIGTIRILNTIINDEITDYKKESSEYPLNTKWKLYIKERILFSGTENLIEFELHIHSKKAVELVNQKYRFMGSIQPMKLNQYSNFIVEKSIETNFHFIQLTTKDEWGQYLQLLLYTNFSNQFNQNLRASLTVIKENEEVYSYTSYLKRISNLIDPFYVNIDQYRLPINKDSLESDLKKLIEMDYFKSISVK